MGHEVHCIAGKTSASPTIELPNVIRAGSPEEMLKQSINLAKSNVKPDVWIHSAAVLDYSMTPEKGKRPSGQDKWEIELQPTLKHIPELADLVGECIRIGFKLETGVSEEELIQKSLKQISNYGVDYVIANILEQIADEKFPRARLVGNGGIIKVLQNEIDICLEIEKIISE